MLIHPYPFSTRHDTEHHYAHELTDEQHVELGADAEIPAGHGDSSAAIHRRSMTNSIQIGRSVDKHTRTNGNNPALERLWINPAATHINTLPLFNWHESNERVVSSCG